VKPATGRDPIVCSHQIRPPFFDGNPRTRPQGGPQGRQDNRAQRGRQSSRSRHRVADAQGG
jgi:hypothetical protein